MKTDNTFNNIFSQQIKSACSMTAGKPCPGIQMIYQEEREKVNLLSH